MVLTTILILAANPKDTQKLRLDQEVRDIEEALRRAPAGRDRFQVIQYWAVRLDDLRRALLEHQPQIVHFSGHGVGDRGLVFEDDQGNSQLADSQGIANLLRLTSSLECVVLNACYSEVQAEALEAAISGCLIGMNQAVGDEAARKFAIGFYDGLFYGESYERAFEYGLTALELERLPQVPVLTWGRRSLNSADVSPRRVFISYKRNAQPDAALALQLVEALSHNHQVFIDQQMAVGVRWRDRIAQEIRQADAMVVLLSEMSVQSEMVELEVKLAQEGAANVGKPTVLPVRVQYREPFQYPLSVYLDPINWAFWEGPEDTSRLLGELQAALRGGDLPVATAQAKQALLQPTATSTIPSPTPSAQPQTQAACNPATLEQPEGTMDPESVFYVERPVDAVALETIAQSGVTLTIKGPRQMGKSSLLLRTIEAARDAGKQVVFLDFQLFDQAALQDADTFYRQFCYCLTDELNLDDEVEQYWARPLGNPQRCTRYVERHILKQIQEPIVLAMDEVERMFDTPFRNDFFSMLRSWHNQRAMKPLWKRLDLALVTSTEPYQLIADLNQSPFNVGQVLRLEDFSPEQVVALNLAHGEPFGAGEVQKLIGLLNGHPYLTRRALYLVASGRLGPGELFATAADERGPFGDHLRYHLFRMYDQRELVEGFLEVLKRRDCENERVFFRLNGAGIVMRQGHDVVPRCQLYAEFFGDHLRQ